MPQPAKLGLIACTSLIVGNMVGAGIFLLPVALAQFGSVSFLGWLISSTGALLMAFVFSTLSEAHPAAGGPYAYSKSMLGNFVGFQVAICYWIAAMFSVAGLIVAFFSYLSGFFPALHEQPYLTYGLELGLLWGITWMNSTGVKSIKVVQVTTTLIKVLPLLVIIVVGFFHIHWDYFSVFNISGKSTLSAAATCAILTTWALMGLESATVPAEHVDNPKRTIPLATYLGTILTAIVYISCSLVMLGLLPNDQLRVSTSPFIEVGNMLFGSWAGSLIGILALISAASCAIGWVFIHAEVPLATARDGLFPRQMTVLNQHRMPKVAAIVAGVFVTIILSMTLSDKMTANFAKLVQYSALGYLLSLSFTAVAAFLTFLKEGEQSKRPSFIKIILGLLATAYMIWIISSSDYQQVYALFMLLLVSAPLYALVQWWNHHYK